MTGRRNSYSREGAGVGPAQGQACSPVSSVERKDVRASMPMVAVAVVAALLSGKGSVLLCSQRYSSSSCCRCSSGPTRARMVS